VVHAGLYYAPGSLKARTCVEGRGLLYARCARDRIAHRKIGKLVVATHREEEGILEALRLRGLANGAGALEMVDPAEREPDVRASAALFSPTSGIVDVHGLAESYAAEAKRHGAELVLRTHVRGLSRGRTWHVDTEGPDGEAFELRVESLVNAAGLDADRIAALAGADAPRHRFCKGDYFALRHRPTQHLIYPVPVHAGLGIHVTLDLGGGFRAGPDTEYVEEPRYDVDALKAEAYAEAIRRYLPRVRASDLTPDYAGIRPKLNGPDEPARDFFLLAKDDAVHLLGIESPGLTASEALARIVADAL
jgi:L-2-hydroxyglutarate oxidase LhgO